MYYMTEKKERVDAIALGRFLKRQRKLRNLTQKEVGERSGRGQGTIAKLESGQVSTVPLEDVESNALGVGSSRMAALRAIKHPSVLTEEFSDMDEDAIAIAEAYRGYQTEEAKEIIRQALAYADSVEKGQTIGGRRAE